MTHERFTTRPEPRDPPEPREHPNDPLHGVTLQALLERLVAHHGWPALAARINVRCFTHDPSVSSSLKFLRKTPWARAKVERLFLELCEDERAADD